LSYIAIAIIVMSILVGSMGRHSKLGFFGIFVLSLVFTPLLVLLVLFFTRPQPARYPGKPS